MKYSGENDNFDFKLTMFHDLCNRADIPDHVKMKAFPTMLRSLALDYYYANIVKQQLDFDGICNAITNYFEGPEYKRSVLSKWNSTSLRSVINGNAGKSTEECLQILISDLHHLQHGLNHDLRTDQFFHNKLINACQDIPACRYACYRPSDTLTGLINDLRSSITTFEKSQPEPNQTFLTDRRYHSLNRDFFIHPPPELNLQPGSILRVLKPLYGIPEAGNHWFNTYHQYHTDDLGLTQSTFDPCLLFTDSSIGFAIVGLQTDDTLFLADMKFAIHEEKELQKSKFMAKDRGKLTHSSTLSFNGGKIKLEPDNAITLTQERQCRNLKPVNVKSVDLTSSRGKIRTAVTPKDQFIAQRARGSYIASVCQPEATFDLSFAAQVINPNEEDAKHLNKRLQWQIDNPTRGLRFAPLDPDSLQLIIFTDASFANNKDLSSQIGFIIALADRNNQANIPHWSSIKCKRITRSVLAAELYAMAHSFDKGMVIKTTIEKILSRSIPLTVCTDSKSLYDCLVKLGTTNEKRLMIDLLCLRQSYERREIAEVKWIDGNTNPADAMTKGKPCNALKAFLNTNKIDLKVTEWVERAKKGMETIKRENSQCMNN